MSISSERFVEAALAASDDCIKVIGLDGSLQYMSEGGKRVMEVDDFEVIKGCPWPDFWQDQGNIDARAAVDAALQGRTVRFTGFANTLKGSRRFWDVKVSPILAEDGSVESILSVSRDITTVKNFEDEQILLRGELSHRMKNLLALVQSIARQTLRDDAEMAVAKPAFLARLAALGRAHDILIQPNQTATTLEAVAKTVVEDQLMGRIFIDGPLITLSPKSGLAIALAFHELTTNAIKYGALSNQHGTVSITWEVANSDEERLSLQWVERGGPIVKQPEKKGFGSRMIERALEAYVRGEVRVDYLPTGVTFSLNAPLRFLAEG
ncbi:HWE histidine kinase domain-containing protein [Allorhizobium taibaishanense]|uniref:histidine kinase n=1 Tax=Allorhizobium taibaishanense TaxID=887144 RepID=A0A1Q9A0W4_9HYPH|nr:HWE histidine kinase domain-containing protein [Allorhizobium taibaishanense]MBB4007794.1 PAS domain S-box-containing protein [Allorhizobium taibaishanense]OLP48136.1 hypothetical protein BJF91_08275 [Allorhizobium taibaishanense]